MKSRDRNNQSQHDNQQFRAAADLFLDDVGIPAHPEPTNNTIDIIEALESFTRYASKACLSKMLARIDIFRNHVLPVHGNIVTCGLLHGADLFLWAKLSNIFEPSNHTRKIIGFDTFEGFSEFHPEKDAGSLGHFKPGDLKGLSLERMQAAVDVYDLNRPLSHIQKIELVQGDLAKTAHEYAATHQYMTVAMLYLDVDLYEPTLAALKAFVPMMPKGAVIVFDEANYQRFEGESRAMADYFPLGKRQLRLQRFPYTSMVSYAVLD